ncbi:hypothetical protein EJB05_14233, partial [Eragrostis curvula]
LAAPPPVPARLPDDLIAAEILARIPPDDPALLLRAVATCRALRGLLADRAFLRRHRDLHGGAAPMLGFVFNGDRPDAARFIPTSSFRPRTLDHADLVALDARHGRVLLYRSSDEAFVVWNPITDQQRELPFPEVEFIYWNAAVLCAAAASCDHLGCCNGGPFLVAFVGATYGRITYASTYSSEADAWNNTIAGVASVDFPDIKKQATLVGNKLYFPATRRRSEERILEFDLDHRQLSSIDPPIRRPTSSAGWDRTLAWVLCSTVNLSGRFSFSQMPLAVVGYADAEGLGAILLRTIAGVFEIDLNSRRIRKLSSRIIKRAVIPYMSFYTHGDHAGDPDPRPFLAGDPPLASRRHPPPESLRTAPPLYAVFSVPVISGHVHGVEDRLGTRFWALGSDTESEEDDEIESIAAPDFIQQAGELGFSMEELARADEEMPVSPTSQKPILVEGSLAEKIINAMVQKRSKAWTPATKPWQGPLPPPRKSPMRTLGDALATAKVRPSDVKKSNKQLGRQVLVLGSDMPYRPTPGLVALFARTGTGCKLPRAPYSRSRLTTAATYVSVARRAMENGGANGGAQGNQQRGGAANRGIGRGAGQGGMVGRGGFQANNQGFHPGYGDRGYTGRGGGRYGNNGRGRHGGGHFHGGRHRGGFGGRLGRGFHGQADGGHQNHGAAGDQAQDAPGGEQEANNMQVETTTVSLPAHAAALLQQVLASLQGMNTPPSQDGAAPKADNVKGGSGSAKLVPIKNLSKATAPHELSESSAQGAAKGNSGKSPYCYRCLRKGHVKENCNEEMYCAICDRVDHFTHRCPKYRGDKPSAVPCGYAVEGLGFYQIPDSIIPVQHNDSRIASIRVTDGVLTIPNVISELERLIAGKWKWNVEDVGNNTFRTLFPSRAELMRMVEWGVVQTKFQKAKLRIEQRMIGDKVKNVMPKIWVQITGLPKELMDFLIIWAIGAILGVTKDVDMGFTRKHDICRMQVLVLDPNLIPQFVDVVIGDYLYELQFMVEENVDEDNPEPMDMDFHGNDNDMGHDGSNDESHTPDGKSGPPNGKGNTVQKGKSGVTGSLSANEAKQRRATIAGHAALQKPVYHITVPGLGGHGMPSAYLTQDTVNDAPGVDSADSVAEAVDAHVLPQGLGGAPLAYDMAPQHNIDAKLNCDASYDNFDAELNHDNTTAPTTLASAALSCGAGVMAGQEHLGAEADLSAPKATSEESVLNSEEFNRELARMGEPEVQSEETTMEDLAAIPEASPVHSASRKSKRSAASVDDESRDRAEKLKASRNEGPDSVSVSGSVACLKNVELSRLNNVNWIDKKMKVIEKEEKELADEEELDKFILNHLCGEIMEEVMDLGNDQDDRIVPRPKPKSKNKVKGCSTTIPNKSQ